MRSQRGPKCATAGVRKEVRSPRQDKWEEGEEIVSSQFIEFQSSFYFNSEALPYQPGIVRPFPQSLLWAKQVLRAFWNLAQASITVPRPYHKGYQQQAFPSKKK